MLTIANTVWRYSIIMEVALIAWEPGYKTRGLDEIQRQKLTKHVDKWRKSGASPLERLFGRIEPLLETGRKPGILLGRIKKQLASREMLAIVSGLLDERQLEVRVLADRLDEGFVPDSLGVAFINGVVKATTELQGAVSRIRPVIFLRDNIFRAIRERDRNYSRNIEGRISRIHWDEKALLKLVAQRLRVVYPAHSEDSDQTVWDAFTGSPLNGLSGFRRVLRQTLYRPRDLILLLNRAYTDAARDQQRRLSIAHLKHSALIISENRLSDLVNEYRSVIPGLQDILDALAALGARFQTPKAFEALEELTSRASNLDLRAFAIIKPTSDADLLKAVYSIGFIGARRAGEERFSFCHDGTPLTIDLDREYNLLIHPCYWRALSLDAGQDMGAEDAEEIYDDYELEVVSVEVEDRKALIPGHVARLANIQLGPSGDLEFFAWAMKSLRILLWSGIRDLEPSSTDSFLHGRITASAGIWSELRNDFGSRYLYVYIRNEETLSLDTVRTAYEKVKQSEAASVVLVCTRSEDENIRRGQVLDAVREYFSGEPTVLVAHATADLIRRSLNKQITPHPSREAAKFLRTIVEKTAYNYMGKKKGRRKAAGPAEPSGLDPSSKNAIHQVLTAAVRLELHLPARRELLLDGLHSDFVAMMPTKNNPRDQLLSDLIQLNRTPSLPGLARAPLDIWLENAEGIRRDARRLRRILNR